MCDKVEWAVEVCKRIGSERMKILFDIYHVQIMQRRCNCSHSTIPSLHRPLPRSRSVPGRNEIDAAQELNYPAIMREIVSTGYTGFVGQEFIPTRDPIPSLREGVRICDV